MELQSETLEYELTEALEYLEKLVNKVKNKEIKDGELFPELEHISSHINASFNTRYMSRKEVSELSEDERERIWNTPQDLIIGG